LKNAHLGSGGSSGEVAGPDSVEPSRAEVVAVRGEQEPQVSMLAFVDVETRIPLDHPLRSVKRLADEALAALSSTFDAM
jgi:hypothetical protein